MPAKLRLSAQIKAKPMALHSTHHEWLWRFLFTIYNSLLLVQQIGFDRSAFVANRHKVAGNQKVKNRVNVRFMTKVFWSIPSKVRNL